jgi:tetratricopeptide (TPR) repeat protein
MAGTSEVIAAVEFFIGVWAAIGLFAYAVHTRHRRRYRLLVEAINDGDVDRAESLWRRVSIQLTAQQRRAANVLYCEACVLALREDWQAALTIVERLCAGKYAWLPVVSVRARCLAELDRGDEAMPIAEAALAVPDLAPVLRATLLITVGIVRLRRGEYEKALATLDQAASLSSMKGLQASSSFYRADALRALGREPEAIAAYERAAAMVPLSRRAAHAQKRLTQAPPSSYR